MPDYFISLSPPWKIVSRFLQTKWFPQIFPPSKRNRHDKAGIQETERQYTGGKMSFVFKLHYFSLNRLLIVIKQSTSLSGTTFKNAKPSWPVGILLPPNNLSSWKDVTGPFFFFKVGAEKSIHQTLPRVSEETHHNLAEHVLVIQVLVDCTARLAEVSIVLGFQQVETFCRKAAPRRRNRTIKDQSGKAEKRCKGNGDTERRPANMRHRQTLSSLLFKKNIYSDPQTGTY